VFALVAQVLALDSVQGQSSLSSHGGPKWLTGC
jgi:hypothetical protein